MAYAHGLEPCSERIGGSSPLSPTKYSGVIAVAWLQYKNGIFVTINNIIFYPKFFFNNNTTKHI